MERNKHNITKEDIERVHNYCVHNNIKLKVIDEKGTHTDEPGCFKVIVGKNLIYHTPISIYGKLNGRSVLFYKHNASGPCMSIKVLEVAGAQYNADFCY